jgi:hypothetical protein
MSETKLTGHCYCGAVTFEIDGKSDWVGHCHCESCRRASGSVMTTFAGFKKDQVTFTGAQPSSFSPGNGVTRSFCGRCGSAIAYENAGEPGELHLHVGLFDNIELLPAQDHSFRNEKASWLTADEHLPDSSWSNPSDV